MREEGPGDKLRFDPAPGAVCRAGSQRASGHCLRGRSCKGLSSYQYGEEVAYYGRGGGNSHHCGTDAGSVASNKSLVKRHSSKLLFAVLALIPIALLAQNLAPTPHFSEQAELSKVEEWVLSQGTEESIAPELAAILGLGSDRLPVKLKSFLTPEGINLTFAVSANPKQKGIVISSLKTMAERTEIYSVGTAWLTDKSGTLRQTIEVNASGAKILPNSSRAAKFEDMKAFFIKKLKATSSTTTLSPSPRISPTAAGKRKIK